MEAIVTTAHQYGVMVTARTTTDISTREAVLARVDWYRTRL
ncbi:hypothetical protein [Flagellimonas aurea]